MTAAAHEPDNVDCRKSVEIDPGGVACVRVSLQDERMERAGSREDRRQRLNARFLAVADEVAPLGILIDMATLSISAGMVEATIPVARFDDGLARLKSLRLRVDPVTTRKAELAR